MTKKEFYKNFDLTESFEGFWEIQAFQLDENNINILAKEDCVILHYFQDKLNIETSIKMPRKHLNDLIKLINKYK